MREKTKAEAMTTGNEARRRSRVKRRRMKIVCGDRGEAALKMTCEPWSGRGGREEGVDADVD